MNNILVLVDFTDTADIAVQQAIAIAKHHNSIITICHVSESLLDQVPDSLMQKFKPYSELAENHGIKSEILVGHGDLFHESNAIVHRLIPELVIVGTHGKVGLKQNIFGSHIYKLVKSLDASTLVISDKTTVHAAGFKKVMLPVAPHIEYLLKVKQTCRLLAKDGKIVIFAIIKPGVPLFDEIVENIETTQNYLDKVGVKWEYQQVESKHYSIGYARDTLDIVKEQEMDLISIMTKVSVKNTYFGSIDKENLILNDLGVPVLCANH